MGHSIFGRSARSRPNVSGIFSIFCRFWVSPTLSTTVTVLAHKAANPEKYVNNELAGDARCIVHKMRFANIDKLSTSPEKREVGCHVSTKSLGCLCLRVSFADTFGVKGDRVH